MDLSISTSLACMNHRTILTSLYFSALVGELKLTSSPGMAGVAGGGGGGGGGGGAGGAGGCGGVGGYRGEGRLPGYPRGAGAGARTRLPPGSSRNPQPAQPGCLVWHP